MELGFRTVVPLYPDYTTGADETAFGGTLVLGVAPPGLEKGAYVLQGIALVEFGLPD